MINLDYENKVKLNYGWSHDSKFILCDSQGSKYLLRQSEISRYEHVKKEFELVQLLFDSKVNVPEPITSYISDDGQTYNRIYRWIEGEMLQDVIASIDSYQQYELGRKAGKLLNDIHTVGFHGEDYDWSIYYQRKIQKKINAYNDCDIRLDRKSVV